MKTSKTDIEMAHEYIIANTKAGTYISVTTAFDYVEALNVEFVKRGREKLNATMNAHAELHPDFEILKSIGEIP
ncbi:hypothetical protein [Acinetobacter puyangensis]|uniref:hypothetical protein n=1 Tax=Acinetobacter puyangensis TaxID=1096779 RepID=UPI003A4D8E5C